MGLFSSRQEPSPEPGNSDGPIPFGIIDLSKRYDLYCSTPESRVYEDFRILGIRAFEEKGKFQSVSVGAYVEIEARDGTRILVSRFSVQMLCEHGSQPKYRVLRNGDAGSQ